MHSMYLNFIPVIVIFALFWFMILMPEKKRKKKFKEMMEALQMNDEVVTRGGIVGTIVGIEEEYITIESAGKTRLKFMRAAIANKVDKNTTVK